MTNEKKLQTPSLVQVYQSSHATAYPVSDPEQYEVLKLRLSRNISIVNVFEFENTGDFIKNR